MTDAHPQGTNEKLFSEKPQPPDIVVLLYSNTKIGNQKCELGRQLDTIAAIPIKLAYTPGKCTADTEKEFYYKAKYFPANKTVFISVSADPACHSCFICNVVVHLDALNLCYPLNITHYKYGSFAIVANTGIASHSTFPNTNILSGSITSASLAEPVKTFTIFQTANSSVCSTNLLEHDIWGVSLATTQGQCIADPNTQGMYAIDEYHSSSGTAMVQIARNCFGKCDRASCATYINVSASSTQCHISKHNISKTTVSITMLTLPSSLISKNLRFPSNSTRKKSHKADSKLNTVEIVVIALSTAAIVVIISLLVRNQRQPTLNKYSPTIANGASNVQLSCRSILPKYNANKQWKKCLNIGRTLWNGIIHFFVTAGKCIATCTLALQGGVVFVTDCIILATVRSLIFCRKILMQIDSSLDTIELPESSHRDMILFLLTTAVLSFCLCVMWGIASPFLIFTHHMFTEVGLSGTNTSIMIVMRLLKSNP